MGRVCSCVRVCVCVCVCVFVCEQQKKFHNIQQHALCCIFCIYISKIIEQQQQQKTKTTTNHQHTHHSTFTVFTVSFTPGQHATQMNRFLQSIRNEFRHQSKALRFDMSRPTTPLLIYTSSSTDDDEDVLRCSDFKTSTDVVAGTSLSLVALYAIDTVKWGQ